jgi:hypothetical protein
MKILIKPSDIIERALWYKYEYYILKDKTQSEIDTIIEENNEFEIPERDALIINLLKCIETDNLQHRLNQHLIHVLDVKSTSIQHNKKNIQVISKNAIEYEIKTYLKNFPEKWNPKKHYEVGLEELKKYIEYLLEKLSELYLHQGEFQGNPVDYYQVNHVKKIMDFNH